MDRGMVLFLGCLLTFSSAWAGLVLAPHLQLGESASPVASSGTESPGPRSDAALRGKRVYEANGCLYCHSQQVRSGTFGQNADIARGWGVRRSVPQDYVNDKPVLLGTMRTGPDLANVGTRWSADWQHKHLYQPRMMVPGSIMPNFKFLYTVQPIAEGQPHPDAIPLMGKWLAEIPDGHEVVPTEDAKNLVAYLLSLQQSPTLTEARE